MPITTYSGRRGSVGKASKLGMPAKLRKLSGPINNLVGLNDNRIASWVNLPAVDLPPPEPLKTKKARQNRPNDKLNAVPAKDDRRQRQEEGEGEEAKPAATGEGEKSTKMPKKSRISLSNGAIPGGGGAALVTSMAGTSSRVSSMAPLPAENGKTRKKKKRRRGADPDAGQVHDDQPNPTGMDDDAQPEVVAQDGNADVLRMHATDGRSPDGGGEEGEQPRNGKKGTDRKRRRETATTDNTGEREDALPAKKAKTAAQQPAKLGGKRWTGQLSSKPPLSKAAAAAVPSSEIIHEGQAGKARPPTDVVQSSSSAGAANQVTEAGSTTTKLTSGEMAACQWIAEQTWDRSYENMIKVAMRSKYADGIDDTTSIKAVRALAETAHGLPGGLLSCNHKMRKASRKAIKTYAAELEKFDAETRQRDPSEPPAPDVECQQFLEEARDASIAAPQDGMEEADKRSAISPEDMQYLAAMPTLARTPPPEIPVEETRDRPSQGSDDADDKHPIPVERASTKGQTRADENDEASLPEPPEIPMASCESTPADEQLQRFIMASQHDRLSSHAPSVPGVRPDDFTERMGRASPELSGEPRGCRGRSQRIIPATQETRFAAADEQLEQAVAESSGFVTDTQLSSQREETSPESTHFRYHLQVARPSFDKSYVVPDSEAGDDESAEPEETSGHGRRPVQVLPRDGPDNALLRLVELRPSILSPPRRAVTMVDSGVQTDPISDLRFLFQEASVGNVVLQEVVSSSAEQQLPGMEDAAPLVGAAPPLPQALLQAQEQQSQQQSQHQKEPDLPVHSQHTEPAFTSSNTQLLTPSWSEVSSAVVPRHGSHEMLLPPPYPPPPLDLTRPTATTPMLVAKTNKDKEQQNTTTSKKRQATDMYDIDNLLTPVKKRDIMAPPQQPPPSSLLGGGAGPKSGGGRRGCGGGGAKSSAKSTPGSEGGKFLLNQNKKRQRVDDDIDSLFDVDEPPRPATARKKVQLCQGAVAAVAAAATARPPKTPMTGGGGRPSSAPPKSAPAAIPSTEELDIIFGNDPDPEETTAAPAAAAATRHATAVLDQRPATNAAAANAAARRRPVSGDKELRLTPVYAKAKGRYTGWQSAREMAGVPRSSGGDNGGGGGGGGLLPQGDHCSSSPLNRTGQASGQGRGLARSKASQLAHATLERKRKREEAEGAERMEREKANEVKETQNKKVAKATAEAETVQPISKPTPVPLPSYAKMTPVVPKGPATNKPTPIPIPKYGRGVTAARSSQASSQRTAQTINPNCHLAATPTLAKKVEEEDGKPARGGKQENDDSDEDMLEILRTMDVDDTTPGGGNKDPRRTVTATQEQRQKQTPVPLPAFAVPAAAASSSTAKRVPRPSSTEETTGTSRRHTTADDSSSLGIMDSLSRARRPRLLSKKQKTPSSSRAPPIGQRSIEGFLSSSQEQEAAAHHQQPEPPQWSSSPPGPTRTPLRGGGPTPSPSPAFLAAVTPRASSSVAAAGMGPPPPLPVVSGSSKVGGAMQTDAELEQQRRVVSAVPLPDQYRHVKTRQITLHATNAGPAPGDPIRR